MVEGRMRYSRPNKDRKQEIQTGLARLCLVPGDSTSHRGRKNTRKTDGMHRATPRMICLAENDMLLPPLPAGGHQPIGHESLQLPAESEHDKCLHRIATTMGSEIRGENGKPCGQAQTHLDEQEGRGRDVFIVSLGLS